jgi:ubiquinol-cytochrome c reductase cytochrome b subunit
MAIAFWSVLTVAGADDILAVALDLPLAGLRWAERIALFGLPPLALVATVRICRGLQQRDRDVLERGVRTGLLDERGDGVFVELRQRPRGVDADGRPVPLAYDGVRVEHSVIEGER